VQVNGRRGVGFTYTGGFAADLCSGAGRQEHTDGETFEGTFLAGKQLCTSVCLPLNLPLNLSVALHRGALQGCVLQAQARRLRG
jgi:hypothetical protein